MQIRKTNPDELDLLLGLYAHARNFMAAHGNPHQWGTSYPERALVEKDISSGCSFVCEDRGRVIAVFYYRKGPDMTYRQIHSGSWIDESPYGVVHRITSDGTVKGAASFCLNWAIGQCGNLRIDTHRDNTVMQRLLAKNGFTYCGIIFTEKGEERLAYQKIL